MDILIINGPNLNLWGREKKHLRRKSFEDYLCELQQRYAQHHIAYYQSNIEGELIEKFKKPVFPATALSLTPVHTHTRLLQSAMPYEQYPPPL